MEIYQSNTFVILILIDLDHQLKDFDLKIQIKINIIFGIRTPRNFVSLLKEKAQEIL